MKKKLLSCGVLVCLFSSCQDLRCSQNCPCGCNCECDWNCLCPNCLVPKVEQIKINK